MKASERLRKASQKLTAAEGKDPTEYTQAALRYAYELGRADQELGLTPQKVDKALAGLARVTDGLYLKCMQEALAWFGLAEPPTPPKPRLTLIKGGRQ